MVDKIKNKTNIDVDKFIERLEKELSINTISNDEKKKEANEQLVYCIYDVLVIILDVTHQNIISEGLYTTWLNMVKSIVPVLYVVPFISICEVVSANVVVVSPT